MRLTSIIATAVTVTALAGAANAATVNESQTQNLLVDGEDFTFTFGGLVPSDGTGGTITIASGISPVSNFNGLDLDEATEFFELSIEGTSFGTFNCGGTGGNANTGGIDCNFSLPITLTGAQLDGFLADGSLTAFVNFSSAVNTFSEQDEVIVSLSYEEGIAAVPLPASGLLLLAGLGAMAARRRKS